MKMKGIRQKMLVVILAIAIVMLSQSVSGDWILKRSCDCCSNGVCGSTSCSNMVCQCPGGFGGFGNSACASGTTCYASGGEFATTGCYCQDADGDGFCRRIDDCNDDDGAIRPDAVDVCDGKNIESGGNDCNPATPDGSGETAPYNPNQKGVCQGSRMNCYGSAGWKEDYSSVPNYQPTETLCDSLDNNCNGQTDEGCTCSIGQTRPCYSGQVGTAGVGLCRSGTQTCAGNVQSPIWSHCTGEVLPSADICDGVDNNCNGWIDEGCDSDQDGYINPSISCYSTPTPKCAGLDGSVYPGTCHGCSSRDCNDGNNSINPGAAESCNGKDDNCNGAIDEGFDADNDLYTSCGFDKNGAFIGIDCNDNNPNIHPGAAEACNGKDDNCNGIIDESFDLDGDSYTTCGYSMIDGKFSGVDCNDNDAAVYPGAPEICDGKDNNCNNGVIDEGCDKDNDNYCDAAIEYIDYAASDGELAANPNLCIAGGDCNDNAPLINPGMKDGPAENCNRIDDNCDGVKDVGCPCSGGEMDCKTDKDGIGICRKGTQKCENSAWSDCIGAVGPQAEIPGNGIDEDCDGSDLASFTPTILTPILFNINLQDKSGIIAYTWDFGDGALFGSPYAHEALPVRHTYASAGTYTVHFRMMDKNFRIFETTKNIKIDKSAEDGACSYNDDCTTKYCNPNRICSTANCTDRWQNQKETDVDCGGGSCSPCDRGKKCSVTQDCKTSLVCDGTVHICRPEAPDDLCSDSDGGWNIFEKGEVTQGGIVNSPTLVLCSDRCATPEESVNSQGKDDLLECFCGNKQGSGGSQGSGWAACPNGCQDGACAPYKIVFVTSGTYNGNIGGLAGADAKCKTEAAAAGLTGTFTAWLSTDSIDIDAKDRIDDDKYRLADGTPIATSKGDLLDLSIAHEINMNADKSTVSGDSAVWTGTDAGGIKTTKNCNNWNSGSGTGTIGSTSSKTGTWTIVNDWPCSNSARLYCFETDLCSNGIKDSSETDVDCGGSCLARCGDGKGCSDNDDCESPFVCDPNNHHCRPEVLTDPCYNSIKDNAETDVDCGGGTCQKCGSGKNCTVNSDCYINKCESPPRDPRGQKTCAYPSQ